MRDTALSLEQDPASDRLQPEQVITIHKMHRLGHGWDTIAEDHGISRKQVSRIVQGRRWAQLHPKRRPELYENDPAKMPEPTYTPQQIEAAWDAARKAFTTTLQQV